MSKKEEFNENEEIKKFKNNFKLRAITMISCGICKYTFFTRKQEPCKSCELDKELENLNKDELKQKIIELIKNS